MAVTRFKEKYVAFHGITPEEYPNHLFWRCVFPHARPIAWGVRLFAPQVFAPDFELIHDAGALGEKPRLREMIKGWTRHPENRGPLRRLLQVRVSVRRLRAEVEFITEAWERREGENVIARSEMAFAEDSLA